MNEYRDQNNLGQGLPDDPVDREPSPGAGEAGGGEVETDRWSSGPSAPPPPPPEPEPYGDRQQGGYRGAPYSPSYDNRTYPPRQDFSQGQGYPPYRPPQQYSPYQYNANSGWQQQPPRPQEKYEWKFEDYDRFDKKERPRSRANRGVVIFTVALLCVLAVGVVGLAGYSIWSASGQSVASGEEPVGESEVTTGAADSKLEIASRPQSAETVPVSGEKMTIPQVAEAVLPSVVGVVKYDNDQFYEMSGYGSGTVMTEDGYIITNAHVVAGGTGFKVQFSNGDAFDAQLIGADAVTDLAVLKISAPGLIPAQFGDSDNIKVGETVVAVGNPAGMEFAGSVTSGIISAVNREVKTIDYQMTFIQIDAAINPGNSGGPLANEYGQVIGINSSKIVAEGYEGIGFAIPITAAKPIIDDIITNGKVTGRVMLGITYDPVDEIKARTYEMQMGLMIKTISPQSDLSAAGAMPGDILTHIDGQRVYDVTDVRAILETRQAGETVTVTLYRRIGTKEQTFDVQTRLLESE